MSSIFTVTPITPLEADFERLREESQGFGFTMLHRLATHWLDGSNVFSAPGEQLLGAFLGAALVGVCGLNRDPFDTHPRAGRVRHLYVSHAIRRVGVGSLLLQTLTQRAHSSFDYLNTRAPESASGFYLQAGFVPIAAHARVTHRLQLA